MRNIRDLAMTFYNEFVENGGDVYEPDSRFSKVMGEVDEILFKLLDFKTANDLEGKILTCPVRMWSSIMLGASKRL